MESVIGKRVFGQAQFLSLIRNHIAVIEMGSGVGKPHWSVYDGVKIIAATPEALMAEIDSAISNLEYARTRACLPQPEGFTFQIW